MERLARRNEKTSGLSRLRMISQAPVITLKYLQLLDRPREPPAWVESTKRSAIKTLAPANTITMPLNLNQSWEPLFESALPREITCSGNRRMICLDQETISPTITHLERQSKESLAWAQNTKQRRTLTQAQETTQPTTPLPGNKSKQLQSVRPKSRTSGLMQQPIMRQDLVITPTTHQVSITPKALQAWALSISLKRMKTRDLGSILAITM